MPILATGFDEEIARWVASRIPHLDGDASAFGPCSCVAVLDSAGTRVLAGCVFHGYVPRHGNIEISFAAASPRWATPEIVWRILAIPFVQYGVRRITMATPHTNDRAIRLIKGLGFTREGTVRQFFGPTTHAAIFGMLKREFETHRILARGRPDGQVVAEAAATA
jgi:RimJ/RimL family protein N-acetyltransferase